LVVAEKLRDFFVRVPALECGPIGDDMPSQLNERALANDFAALGFDHVRVGNVAGLIVCTQRAISKPGNLLAKLIHAQTILQPAFHGRYS